MTYKELILASDNTCFLYQGENIFKRTFQNALKFHIEGLAPVQDERGWLHIDMKGNDLYDNRYDRTFGFYFKRAAVIKEGNWFHIDVNGKRVYQEDYAWCGNYQQNVCTIRNHQNEYFHINAEGKPCYLEKYNYAGDFRDGYAVVRMNNQECKHIDLFGEELNNKRFLDLGVFHKSIATAKDEKGWFHINMEGKELYTKRYKQIEPFYNGFALVETIEGVKQIIDESGRRQVLL